MVISLAIVWWGCPSLSTFQTVDTVPEGETRFAVGAEALGVSADSGGGTVPQIEFGMRYGLSDNLDLGAKLFLAGLEMGVKYQFMNGSFDAAIAPAASFSYFSSGDASTGFLYVHLPVLFGYNLSDSFAVAFGPKFIYAAVFGDITVEEDSTDFSGDGLLGGGFVSFPIKLGDAFWIAPEINIYAPFTGDTAFESLWWQGGLAFMFGGADSPEPAAE